jgi:hypothetical protein
MKTIVTIIDCPDNNLQPGDVFLWQSALTGRMEIHTFHSDKGYGIKTYTEYNEKDGSSMVVNHSGVRGKIVVPFIDVTKELPLELQTVGTDMGLCYYSHVHLQWFHEENNMPFDVNEIKPHYWMKI